MVLGCFSLLEKIRRGQLPHTSPAIGYNARSKWELCQSRPELFGMGSGESGDGPAAFSVEGCGYGRWVEGRADDDHAYQQPGAETMRAAVDLAKPPDPRERLLGPRPVTDTALDKKRNAMRA